jgi:isopenicillin-N N-acyltransferase-like protein
VPLTNHLEGPLAKDPANLRVEATTSTWPRRKRLDELLANLPPGATVQDAVRVLRDKLGPGGERLPLGDRRTLDALIATHGVVMDATAKALWVSEGPHLTGRFVRFDLARLLAPEYPPGSDTTVETVPADPIADSGEYDAWVRSGSPHHGAN